MELAQTTRKLPAASGERWRIFVSIAKHPCEHSPRPQRKAEQKPSNQECLQKCSGLLARLPREVSPLKGWSSRSVARRMPPHSSCAFWCDCNLHSASTREGYRASAATNKPVSGLTGGEDTTGVSHLCIYMPYCAHVSTLSMF